MRDRTALARGWMLLTILGLTAWTSMDPAPVRAALPTAPTASTVARDAALRYDDWFTDEALRVDLFHTGTHRDSSYSLDEIVWEPAWPGVRRHLIDPFGYGTHRVRLTDAATGRELYRQGYATLFEEWMGTEEAAQGVRRSMSESVRVPWPRKPVKLHVDKRQRSGLFSEVFSLPIDPASHQISRARPFDTFQVLDLSGGPPPHQALDIVILPDGYSQDDDAKLRADFNRFAQLLLSYEPWKANRSRLHVRGVLAYSRESGATEPRKGLFRDTLLGTSFNTFDSERYLTVMHTKRMRQIASLAPYDAVFIMVNSSRYGGGGVYNQWSIFTSDNEYDDYVMLHEFGHHVGGLGDEYYSSAIATDEDALYPPGVEPWEPNITAFLNRKRESIKWHRLIKPETPLPTPETEQYGTTVGAFEGAGYKAKGLFRPQADCKMFHKGLVEFCAVCKASLTAMVRYYAGEDLEP